MNATSLYVSTCRLVLQADAEDPNSWTDLYRLVPYLRQSLSCTVCSNLLIEPHTPTETNCQHHVCRGCRGGRKKLKPSCGWCKDYDKYVENVQLRILLQCYKKLCEYLTSTGIYRTLLLSVTSANSATTNGAPSTIGATSLMELIQEGAGFKDEFKSNAGLSKSAYSILPCVYTSTTSTQTQGNSIQTTEAISQSIPGVYYYLRVQSSGSFKKPRSSSARSKRKGCRCGNATAIPGKLTCCGQRCPCYVESKPCVECRCRGCRNPHTADGLKIRPHIPELHNLQLQLSTSLDCDALSGDPLGSVPQCLSTSPTTIQVLNVYSTPRLDIDNVPQNLPAALLVGEDAIVSTESEAEDSDIQIDV
ncbi:male-specific lethal 2-like 1 protein [Lasius niger]|uniref:E3 ubiquitin-protein ligase MSL2 n=1 Tax=Lasius niger TaxID=67767 RepID=A0A0J7KPY7_LASNI|nr:male-specific lethal 2-like 1 protein [Lasius niger]